MLPMHLLIVINILVHFKCIKNLRKTIKSFFFFWSEYFSLKHSPCVLKGLFFNLITKICKARF